MIFIQLSSAVVIIENFCLERIGRFVRSSVVPASHRKAFPTELSSEQPEEG